MKKKYTSANKVLASITAVTLAFASPYLHAEKMFPGKYFGSNETMLCDLQDKARSVAKISFSSPVLKEQNVERLAIIASTAMATGSILGVSGKDDRNKTLVAAALKHGVKNTEVPVVVFDDEQDLKENEVRVLVLDSNGCKSMQQWRTQAVAVAGVVRNPPPEPADFKRNDDTRRIEASELLYRADMGRRDIYVRNDKTVPYAILPDATAAVAYLKQHGCDTILDEKGFHLDCAAR